ncbi:MAG: 16S rRNA (guanine(527)-N(7))-methyltransferase RsmG [Clostridiales bacterium]|nr:16S rRNA (guanine(527)-N(7))-methyltransferase RsmG [Clostridiales bacterium]
MIDEKLLEEYIEKSGLSLDNTAMDRLDSYAAAVVEKNKVMNLTAITEPYEFTVKHIIDSLSLFMAADIKPGAKVMDVGTGAGFPGMVLLIARPEIKLSLLDSTRKKLDFINETAQAMGLSPEIIHLRAEEAGKKPEYREKFDVVTARAVSNLRDLSEYCLPFVRVGGVFAAMKGAGAGEEIAEAKTAIKLLGGKISEIKSLKIEGAGERNIIIIEKISHTATKYPRSSAQIAKNPIR